MALTDRLKELWAKLTKGAGSAAGKTKDVAGDASARPRRSPATPPRRPRRSPVTVVEKTKEVASGVAKTKESPAPSSTSQGVTGKVETRSTAREPSPRPTT